MWCNASDQRSRKTQFIVFVSCVQTHVVLFLISWVTITDVLSSNCITISTAQRCVHTCKFLQEMIYKNGAFNFFEFNHKPFLLIYLQLIGKMQLPYFKHMFEIFLMFAERYNVKWIVLRRNVCNAIISGYINFLKDWS